MLVDQHEVIPYLVERKLVSEKSIIDGVLSVQDLSRRNRNFRVICENGASYLLKQGVTREGRASVAREARVLRLTQSIFQDARLSEHVPALRHYDSSTGVLVLDLFNGATDLRQHYARTGRFGVEIAGKLGAMIARLHERASNTTLREELRRLTLPPPWILSQAFATVEDLIARSPGSLQVVRVIQNAPQLLSHFQELSSTWSASTLIHGDLKWDNCLIYFKTGRRRRNGLAVVDWETAGMGDPCWDVGSSLSDYLAFWVLSMPVYADSRTTSLPQMAQFPLEVMQPAARRLWEAYLSSRRLSEVTAVEFLARSMRFAAARLVQTAFELMQMRTELTGGIIAVLQLAENTVLRPIEAAHNLLGLNQSGVSRG
jgi:5-methylthioribose kinase